MQQIRVEPPKPEDLLEASKADVRDWFEAPPFEPASAPWQWLTPEAGRDTGRLSNSFHRLFEHDRDEWFSASRDRPEYVAAFRESVLATADASDPVYVLHRRFAPYGVVYTTVGGFLDCWPRLRLSDHRGFDLFPLDLAFWLTIAATGTALLKPRAV